MRILIPSDEIQKIPSASISGISEGIFCSDVFKFLLDFRERNRNIDLLFHSCFPPLQKVILLFLSQIGPTDIKRLRSRTLSAPRIAFPFWLVSGLNFGKAEAPQSLVVAGFTQDRLDKSECVLLTVWARP